MSSGNIPTNMLPTKASQLSNTFISTNMLPTKASHISNRSTSEQLTVLDACNDEFIFIKLANGSITFEYKPMQPINSCSGTYSGGKPVFKYLQAGDWGKVMDVFQQAKDHQKPNGARTKGTLLLKYQSGETVDTCIIDFFTEFGKEITDFYQAYKE